MHTPILLISSLISFLSIRQVRKDPRKGWDLLQLALAQLSTQMSNLVGVIFGQSEPQDSLHLGLPLYWAGSLHDEITLALLYNAADVAVVPSRQDNLPQIGVEAQSCGCLVVAFNIDLPEAPRPPILGE